MGREFDWFATDRDGHVGHFSTAGFGSVPRAAESTAKWNDALMDFLRRSASPREAERVGFAPPMPGEWLDIARHGLYSFDWRHWEGPYSMMAYPKEPLLIEDLPEAYRAAPGAVQFETLCFGNLRSLRPEKLVPCRDSC
jgi:hypothetical protein